MAAEKLMSLNDLLLHELSDLYSAEEQILEALPKVIEAANSPKLVQALKNHLAETKNQVTRLDQCFKELGAKPSGETCAAMKGILSEGAKFLKLKDKADPAVFDAGLVAACQRVEHYEIAGYGCARTYCEQLGLIRCADLLQQTLDEEGNANKSLTHLAEGNLNIKADMAGASAAA
jgi:ferritin-like metal-binding protein YciE